MHKRKSVQQLLDDWKLDGNRNSRIVHVHTTEEKQAKYAPFPDQMHYKLFEQEFGSLLSPMEYETIGMWFDQDQHSPSLIRLALKEAVLAQKLSLRYIDRILFEWKKKNIKTVEAAEKESSNFRQQIPVPKQVEQISSSTKVSFYNWLEERE